MKGAHLDRGQTAGFAQPPHSQDRGHHGPTRMGSPGYAPVPCPSQPPAHHQHTHSSSRLRPGDMRTSPTHGEGGREWGNPWGEPALGAASKLRGLSMGEAASPRQLPLHEEACGQSQHRATARQPGAGHATCTETFQAGSPVSLQPSKAEDAVPVPRPLPRLIPCARGAPVPPNLCWAKTPGASALPAPSWMGAGSGHGHGASRPHGTPRHRTTLPRGPASRCEATHGRRPGQAACAGSAGSRGATTRCPARAGAAAPGRVPPPPSPPAVARTA